METTQYHGIYKNLKSIVIDMTIQGIRVRETIPATPTAERLKFASEKRMAVIFDAKMGVLDYARHFPDSKNLMKFARNKSEHISIEQATNLWFKRNSKNWAASTYKGYWSKVKTHILPNFGHLSASDFKPSIYKQWAAECEIGAKSINEVRSILRNIFNELVFDELLESNPIDKCKPAKRIAPEPNPFTEEERAKIIQALPDNSARDFYIFCFWTGLRTGEALGLRWQDVDFAKKRIYIRQSIVNGKLAATKTKGSARTHELHELALPILEKLRKVQSTDTDNCRIFLDPRTNKPWKYDGVPRERFWAPALKSAGVDYRCPYTCRHTYASHLLTDGCDPTWLAKQLGHSDWGMIRSTYARWMK